MHIIVFLVFLALTKQLVLDYQNPLDSSEDHNVHVAWEILVYYFYYFYFYRSFYRYFFPLFTTGEVSSFMYHVLARAKFIFKKLLIKMLLILTREEMMPPV